MSRRILNTIIGVCHQGDNIVVERFGKAIKVIEPGLYLSIPIMHTLRRVDMREIPLAINPQDSVTKDNVRVKASGSLFVVATDPMKICYGSVDPHEAVTVCAKSIMRTLIGEVELDRLFHNREYLNHKIHDQIKEAATPWGLEVKRYELTDIIADAEVSKAMDKQGVAERDRRQTILNADAKKQHDIAISEGEKISIINRAEADRQRKILEAEGISLAIERIASAISSEHGQQVLKYQLSEKYLATLSDGLHKSSTVFIPKDVSDIGQIMAQAAAILKPGLGKN